MAHSRASRWGCGAPRELSRSPTKLRVPCLCPELLTQAGQSGCSTNFSVLERHLLCAGKGQGAGVSGEPHVPCPHGARGHEREIVTPPGKKWGHNIMVLAKKASVSHRVPHFGSRVPHEALARVSHFHGTASCPYCLSFRFQIRGHLLRSPSLTPPLFISILSVHFGALLPVHSFLTWEWDLP